MRIEKSTPEDINLIFDFYAMAMEFQKVVSPKQWQGFERSLIQKELLEGRQYKIIIDEKVACVFVITFEDKAIWGEKDQNDAIYLHRIVTHSDFRGQNLVTEIANWSKNYTKSIGRKFVRMDTWGDNEKLIAYYQKCGFDFLGIITPDATFLPKHYSGIQLSLFEIEVD